MGALFVLVPLLIVGAAYGVFYAQSKAELEAEIAKIRARGEPVWCSEVFPGSTDAMAAGDRLYKLMEELPPPSDEFTARLEAEPPTPPGDYPEFRTALADQRDLLAAIVQAARYPGIRFRCDLNVKLPVMMPLPETDKFRLVHNLLRADVLQSLGTGKTPRALEAIGEGLDLQRAVRGEPWFGCRMLCYGLSKRMLDLLETTLRQVQLRPDDLRALDDRLAVMEPEVRMASAIQSERAIILTMTNAVGSKEFGEFLAMIAHFSDADDPAFRNPGWKNFWWGTGFYRPRLMHEQAFVLRMMSCMAAVIDQPGLAGKRACDRLDADLSSMTDSISQRTELLQSGYGDVRRTALNCRQRLITARLALRVCRYRAEQGKWPASLEAVLDKELRSLTKGLFSERPLVYDVEEDGFAIYDVDPDGQEPRGRFAVKGVKSE